MEKERRAAIDKFLARRTDGLQLGKLVMDNPDLLKDTGLRESAFEDAQTHYKLMLLKTGLSYMDVYTAVESIRNGIAVRNGKLEFIITTETCWNAMQSEQSRETPVVLATETEYLVGASST